MTVRKMTVTEILEFSKSKYKVFIDEEFAFVLYRGELRQLKISSGSKIDKETYERIMTEILPKRARLRAIHLLEKKPYTEQIMRGKLTEGLYPSHIIDDVIEYLKGYGYIDDRAYVAQYFETYAERKSVRCMERDLLRIGIDRDIIRDVADRMSSAGELGDEEVMIRKLLEKRGFDRETADNAKLASTMRYLYSKGFSQDAINKVLRQDF